jgi:type II secretory pathway pseudopilin PulG
MKTTHFPIKSFLDRPLRGFTLVETLVSITIVTLTVLGPLSVATSASAHARDTKNTLISTYLAQEAIELLRHQQDSVYIRCIQGTIACTMGPDETADDAAWRIFKERLGSNPQGATCFAAPGCSYDFIDMTTNQDNAPTKYRSDAAPCNSLSIETASNLYVCAGARGSGAGYLKTGFTRSVQITSVTTIPGDDAEYNDDLIVTVTVTFKRPNGFTKQIQVVDFLHARA